MKINYGYYNQVFEELRFYNDYQKTQKSFPIGYILKVNDFGADINFYFGFNDSKIEDNIIITGYVVDYGKIQTLKDVRLLGEHRKVNGKVDNRTKNGLIVFEKEMIEKDFFESSDYYYYIVINNSGNSTPEFHLEINLNLKSVSNYSIPYNKYISGRFSIKNVNQSQQSQKYYINFFSDKENSDDKFIIEFSSNFENITLVLDDNLKNHTYRSETNDGEIKKYFIKKNKNEENYFEIQLNYSKNNISKSNDNYLEYANYIIKFYPESYEEEEGINN